MGSCQNMKIQQKDSETNLPGPNDGNEDAYDQQQMIVSQEYEKGITGDFQTIVKTFDFTDHLRKIELHSPPKKQAIKCKFTKTNFVELTCQEQEDIQDYNDFYIFPTTSPKFIYRSCELLSSNKRFDEKNNFHKKVQHFSPQINNRILRSIPKKGILKSPSSTYSKKRKHSKRRVRFDSFNSKNKFKNDQIDYLL